MPEQLLKIFEEKSQSVKKNPAMSLIMHSNLYQILTLKELSKGKE